MQTIPYAAQDGDPDVFLTTFRSAQDPRPHRAAHVGWRDLAAKWPPHKVRAEKDGLAFSLAKLREGTTRAAANVEEITGVALDFDHGARLNDVVQRLRDKGIEAIAYTTFSHAPEDEKFRIVLPLRKAIKPAEYARVWAGANTLTGGVADAACRDVSRLFYLPSCPPERAHLARVEHVSGRIATADELVAMAPSEESRVNGAHVNGHALDGATLAAARERARALNDEALGHEPMPETPEQIERVRSALAALNADCEYEIWRNTVFATLATGWTCARELAREWSASAPARFDPGAFEKLADSFHDRADGVGVGSLFHTARAAGWVDPARALTIDGDVQAGGDETTQAQPLALAIDDVAGDIACARAFAQRTGGGLKFVHSRRRWLCWTGRRWAWCDKGEEVEAAKAFATKLVEAAARKYAIEGNESSAAKRWYMQAVRTHKEAGLRAMLSLARSEAVFAVSGDGELDADADLLGVRNGVVDLRTGTLLRADPRMLITRQVGATFDARAECPKWRAFLLDVFDGDAELVGYVQRAVGYSLTGHVGEEVLFFAYGHGANGKSVFANVLSSIFADYAITAPASLLVARRENGGPRDDIARLAGARLVLANETQAGERLDEQTVKTLVSRERIAARFLYGSHFEFQPSGKIWVRGNHKPIITGDDFGIWRRIHLIPFSRTFDGERCDPRLEEKLLAERDGILAWAVAGAAQWHHYGLKPPAAVVRASAAYRQESDWLGQFIEEECRRDPGVAVSQRLLYRLYISWAQENGTRPMAKGVFTRRLAERGVGVARSSTEGREWVYTGLGTRP